MIDRTPELSRLYLTRSLLLFVCCAQLLVAGCATRTVAPSDSAGRNGAQRPAPEDRPRFEHRDSRPPGERTVRLGQSHEGRPIEMIVFGDGGPTVFVFGGIHGSEPGSAALAGALVAHLRDNLQIVEGCTVAILPAANPDGLAMRRRTNTRRVDLNRDFPAANWRPLRGRLSGHGA